MEENLTEVMRAFEADHVWVSDNLPELLKLYAEQWIAVKNRRVIASDTTLEALRPKVPDPAHTCVGFITLEPLEMVL